MRRGRLDKRKEERRNERLAEEYNRRRIFKSVSKEEREDKIENEIRDNDTLEEELELMISGLSISEEEYDFYIKTLVMLYRKNTYGIFPSALDIVTYLTSNELEKENALTIENSDLLIKILHERNYIVSIDRSQFGGQGLGYKLEENFSDNFKHVFSDKKYDIYNN